MKIVVFTPALRASAIGRMARLVVVSLVADGHEVTVVRSEIEKHLERPAHDFGLPLIAWNDAAGVAAAASAADCVVYQIGDNFEYHRGCLEWMSTFPGIVCLHDFFLVHLFLGWADSHGSHAREVIDRWYGAGANEEFFAEIAAGNLIAGTHERWPMTEWICAMAHGVVTHSQWGLPRVRRACAGPVAVLPLAYDRIGTAVPTSSWASKPMVNILTVGHVNPNKRIESVIRAIGSSDMLRERTTYRLAGQVSADAMQSLSALARRSGVRLNISGDVDDAELAVALGNADIVTCLRWPSLEAASASAVEAMLCGKAVVVTDTGFYRELPDDYVMKIDAANEIASLRIVLEALVANPGERRRRSQGAQAWAQSKFTAEGYAKGLASMAEATGKAAPLLATANRFGALLGGWGGTERQLTGALAPLSIFSIDPGR